MWAERTGATAWHPRHIAERYGLFTLIVLGESVLAASMAIQAAIDTGESLADVAPVAVGGLLIVFSMWWMYFEQPVDAVIDHARHTFGSSPRAAFAWGYGHFIVFASAAAVGAGLEVAVDRATHHTQLSNAQAGATVAVPVGLYLLSVWALHASQKPPGPMRMLAVPVTAALAVTAIGVGEPVLSIGLIVATLIVLWSAIGHRYSSA